LAGWDIQSANFSNFMKINNNFLVIIFKQTNRGQNITRQALAKVKKHSGAYCIKLLVECLSLYD